MDFQFGEMSEVVGASYCPSLFPDVTLVIPFVPKSRPTVFFPGHLLAVEIFILLKMLKLPK